MQETPVRAQTVEFHCPFCRARNQATMRLSADAQADPDSVRAVLDGTFFDHPCWHCGEVVSLDHGARFTDAGRGVVIENRPPSDPFEGLLDGSPPEGPALRRVRDSNTFRELARIWMDGLDDAAALLLKHMLAARVLTERGAPPVLCAYESTLEQDGETWLQYVLFATEESEAESVMAPVSAYRELAAAASPFRREALPDSEWVDWDDRTALRLWEKVQSRQA